MILYMAILPMTTAVSLRLCVMCIRVYMTILMINKGLLYNTNERQIKSNHIHL